MTSTDQPAPLAEPTSHRLVDGDLVLNPVGDGDGVLAFACHWQGQRVGRVELLDGGSGDAELIWVVLPEYRDRDIAMRALRLVAQWGFDELRLYRIEAYVDTKDRLALRAALQAGLRREGLLRGSATQEGERRDTVVLGRLRDDPGPDTREGFIGMLNSTLPTKRAIAQGVIRNDAGGVLLCELVYKREWDLPGGVVDPLESPAECVVREIREELGLDVVVHGLLAVNWLPPWRGWSDATVFVFDLGVGDSSLPERAALQPREIRALHWCGEEELEERVAPYNQRLLAFLATTHHGGTAYLEDGLPAL
jgi:8-oxo-dGTP pyrophosphatase MutT (NUDIX family)